MIIDGKKIAEEVLAEARKEVEDKNIELSLGAVLVGDDPEFKKFVDLKRVAAERVGINFTTYKFSKDIKTEELKNDLREIFDWTDGILVELPLPKQIDQQAILNEVSVEKDVDVLSDEAQELFYENRSEINPPAVEALKIVLEKNHINLKGKSVVIFGFGILIGKPIAHWLATQGAEASVIRSKTKNSVEISLKADIIISGVGKPGLVKGDMVQDGAIVIDFGYGKNSKGKMVGDVDFDSVLPKVSMITPVPGGMGPILIATVIKNLIKLKSKK